MHQWLEAWEWTRLWTAPSPCLQANWCVMRFPTRLTRVPDVAHCARLQGETLQLKRELERMRLLVQQRDNRIGELAKRLELVRGC